MYSLPHQGARRNLKGRQMVKVSVVMPTYNNGGYLRSAIDSILLQTYGNFELIVVDDASTDNTFEILNLYNDSRIKIIRHVINTGVSTSRNDGMNAAIGEYIAVMDGDDISYDRRLERQVHFLDAHPEYGIVGCSVFDNIDIDGSLLFRTHVVQHNEEIRKTLIKKWCFWHASVMFRKELLKTVGGYRKEFAVAEDHDFILRILEHTKAANLPDNLGAYRINPRSLTITSNKYLCKYEALAFILANDRRNGNDEKLAERFCEIVGTSDEKASPSHFPILRAYWNDRMGLAIRYYGFGCKQLFVNENAMARRCFFNAIKSNMLFCRAWVGLLLTVVPFVITRKLRFLFQKTGRYYKELSVDE